MYADYHISELYFVWDNAWPPLIHIFSDSDKQMANTFGLYVRPMSFVPLLLLLSSCTIYAWCYTLPNRMSRFDPCDVT